MCAHECTVRQNLELVPVTQVVHAVQRADIDDRELPPNDVSNTVLLRAQGHVLYLYLIGDDAAGSKSNADFFRPPRIEVTQPQVPELASRAETQEMLDCSKVASIPVVLPEELPARARARSITRSQ